MAVAAPAGVPGRRCERVVLRPDRRASPATAGTSGAATSRTATARRWSSTGGPRSRRRFYRATLADPFGLRLRRRFIFAGRELSDVFDEDFDDPDSLAGIGRRARPVARRAGPRPYRPDARHRRDDPGRAGRDHPRAARTLPRRAGWSGHGQDRGRSAPRRVLALRAPRVCCRARACSSSVRTRSSCATSARCSRRWARRPRRRRPSTGCCRCASGSSPTTGRRRGGEGRRAHGRRDRARHGVDDQAPRRRRDARVPRPPPASRTTSWTASSPTRERRGRAGIDAASALPRRRSCAAAYAQYTRGELLGTDEDEWGSELLAVAENRKAVDGCWQRGQRRRRSCATCSRRRRCSRARPRVCSTTTEQALLAPAASRRRDVDDRATCRCLTRPRRW